MRLKLALLSFVPLSRGLQSVFLLLLVKLSNVCQHELLLGVLQVIVNIHGLNFFSVHRIFILILKT